MIKTSFFLKKPNDNQENLMYITVDSPKKVLEGELAGKCYACKVYLPISSMEKSPYLIYSVNPIDAVYNALGFAKSQLQFLIARGFTISELETHEPWKLEKKDPQTLLQETIDGIKKNRYMPPEDKQKALNILKENFGGLISIKSNRSG